MIRLLNLILFSTTLMFSTTSFSQPIVILEYRGSNNQNLSEDISNNIFMMDPDHTEKHTVPKGQSLSEIIDDYYSGSGLDKRFLKLAMLQQTQELLHSKTQILCLLEQLCICQA